MDIAFPGESPQYREARNLLLEQEMELRRVAESVAVARRALPPGGVIPQDYAFDSATADGGSVQVTLSELFAPGQDTLILYSFMFPRSPEEDLPCPSCTAFLDSFDGAAQHIIQRVNLAVVAKAPLSRIVAHANERGWRRLRLLSSAPNTYNRDYLGEAENGQQLPMLNVFHRDGTKIRHFWGSELLYAPPDPGQDPRHGDTIDALWNLFDFTPDGRGTDWYPALRY